MTSPAKLKRLRVTSRFATDTRLDRQGYIIYQSRTSQCKRLKKANSLRQRELAFLQLPEHCITLPGKKDTVTVNKIKRQKMVLGRRIPLLLTKSKGRRWCWEEGYHYY